VEEPFEIEKQAYGVLVRFKSGTEVTPDLIIQAMDRENERYAIKGRRDLWDFRSCPPSADLGYDAVQRLIFHIENCYQEWSAKTAILVDEAIQLGLSRMFQTLADGYPTQVGVFKEEKSARQWVSQSINPQGGANHDHHPHHR
jgi:hypothetical protein